MATWGWKIANGLWTGSTDLGVVPLNWHVVGTGDFSHNGTSDIAWLNSDGSVGTWEMTNGLRTVSTNVGQVPDGWNIADHHFDLL